MTDNRTQCPRCGDENTTLVADKGFLQKTARVFYLFPFRCKNCDAHFTVFKFGLRYNIDDADRRQFQRVDVRFPIGISIGDRLLAAHSVDVSAGGCALTTESTIEVGEIVTISLQMFDKRPPIWVDAAVVRSRQEGGYCIEFVKMDEEDRIDLDTYIQQLLCPEEEPVLTA